MQLNIDDDMLITVAEEIAAALDAAKANGIDVDHIEVAKDGRVLIHHKSAKKVAREKRKLDPVTSLYRHFDSSGRLLYIGIAVGPIRRLNDHRLGSHWDDQVDTIKIERHLGALYLAAKNKICPSVRGGIQPASRAAFSPKDKGGLLFEARAKINLTDGRLD